MVFEHLHTQSRLKGKYECFRFAILGTRDVIVSLSSVTDNEKQIRSRRSCVTRKSSCIVLVLSLCESPPNLFISRRRSFQAPRWVPGPVCLPETKKAFIRETPLAANFFSSSSSFSSLLLPRVPSLLRFSCRLLVFDRMHRYDRKRNFCHTCRCQMHVASVYRDYIVCSKFRCDSID